MWITRQIKEVLFDESVLSDSFLSMNSYAHFITGVTKCCIYRYTHWVTIPHFRFNHLVVKPQVYQSISFPECHETYCSIANVFGQYYTSRVLAISHSSNGHQRWPGRGKFRAWLIHGLFTGSCSGSIVGRSWT